MFLVLKQAYSAQSSLFTGTKLVNSTTGLQHGDLVAPLCFDLTIGECFRPRSSRIYIWYLDDGVLSEAPETTTTEVDTLR